MVSKRVFFDPFELSFEVVGHKIPGGVCIEPDITCDMILRDDKGFSFVVGPEVGGGQFKGLGSFTGL